MSHFVVEALHKQDIEDMVPGSQYLCETFRRGEENQLAGSSRLVIVGL